MTSYRLAQGGLIDRAAPLGFQFDGWPLQGCRGDTLASALLANGRNLVGRSFKYHRPRGILTAGAAEPNALLTIGQGGRREPNTRATMQELYDGLIAESQNRWPSLDFDIGAFNSLLSPFLAAGFYYKTFMWPAAFWERVYEPLIRKAAGLGKASHEADPDRYEKAWLHGDLLIIGAGPAGLAAALTAGRAGLRVILADENAALGGSLLAETADIGNQPAQKLAKDILAELESLPNIRILPRTTVFGWYDGQVFGAVERVQKHLADPKPGMAVERLWRIAARHALLASGSEERPLVFGNNDLPGIMMAGAMRRYLNQFAVAPGKRPAIFTTNDSGYALAADLETAGIPVQAIIDSRAEPAIAYAGQARVVKGGHVLGAKGGKALSAITIAANGREETLPVDALAMSGGFSPVIHLACHRGGKPIWSDRHAGFLAPLGLQGLTPIGAAAGLGSLAACLVDGANRAAQLAADMGHPYAPADFQIAAAAEETAAASPLWFVPAAKGKAFVDFQNDVGLKDLQLAVQEGYGDVELAKRYTTNGMATDQGKLSNINAIGILAEKRGVSPAEIGTTTFRPFYTPVSFGALAGSSHGKHFQPVRKSPLHGWAEKRGAVFVETGLWYRSSWFPRADENTWRESVDREVLTVRSAAGLCDVSTLGKIDIFGKDAAEFLNRVYSNTFRTLPIGKARYGLMLREDGMIYDDGTTSRLGEEHFFMTTTTAYAAGVMNHLEFCAQALWPDLDVRMASVTDQWAQVALAGPRARDILRKIVDDDISNSAFPFLAAKEISLFAGRLRGRLFRISFSGELAYEIAVPAGYGECLADALMQAGAEYGICAYGTEALSVLRVEKGHVTHAEINGTATPADLGMGKMAGQAKPDYIGKTMLQREGLVSADRLRLVGIKPIDPKTSFKTGSHILAKNAAPSLANDQGYVTSTAYSPHIGSTIGLALVKDGAARRGEEVLAWNALREEYTPALLCDPVFVDPTHEKLHA